MSGPPRVRARPSWRNAQRNPAAPGSPWRAVAVVVAVALACSGIVSADRAGFPRYVGVAAGATAALLGVLALPSFPTRRVALALLAFGGLAAARHAALPGVDVKVLGVWAIATLLALLLVDRAQSDETPDLAGSTPPPHRTGEIVRAATVLTIAVFVAVVALAPTIASAVRHDSAPGAQPGQGGFDNAPSSLRRGEQLDMTSRPRLSNDVVFTVDAKHPDFWRGETWDVWTGSGWQRSNRAGIGLPRQGLDVPVYPARNDVVSSGGDTMRQTFRLEAPYADVLFGAPSVVNVRTAAVLLERDDGTVFAPEGFGRGATYTVTSHRAHATRATLSAAPAAAVPAAILQQYAQNPQTTTRVRRLAADITGGAPSAYDKVLAIEQWLANHTKYSLDAPPSRSGQDAVDQFVFDTHRGWCEQVASTLVVMLRSVGVPARVATGFVTGSRDPLTGRYVVRGRDAHAWAEVYFGGVGWQGFDPTASVPLAGEAGTATSWLEQARAVLPFLLIGAAVIGALLFAFSAIWSRSLRWPRRRTGTTVPWAAVMLARVERLGRRAQVPARPGETVREYAGSLAEHLGEPQLATVGSVIDADAFSAHGVAPAERSAAESTLTQVELAVRERLSKRRRARVVPSKGRAERVSSR